MKRFIRSKVVGMLGGFARKRLKRYPVKVAGVTGSVGKTTTKEVIKHIMKGGGKRVWANKKSYNSEFGLPLTVLELEVPKRWWGWAGVLMKAWRRSRKKPWFRYLVVEMGVDKRGDMDDLLRIVRPEVGVMLKVAPVHMEEGQFSSLDEIGKEKGKLVEGVSKKGVVILNQDDERVWEYAKKTKARVVGFGKEARAEVRYRNLEEGGGRISFRVECEGQQKTFRVPVVGKQNVMSMVAGVAVASKWGIGIKEAGEYLRDFKMPPGRMNLIEGRNETKILDGSYNANPVSVRAALETLYGFGEGRRIAVLGQMNELGGGGEQYHWEIGKVVAKRADILVAVYGQANLIKQGAWAEGMPQENIYFFEKAEKAGDFLYGFIRPGDVILFKGSQNKVRLERAVKMIMKNPGEAGELLCRQGEEWN